MHHDYTTIGHVTIDVLEDGTRRPGGSAFYAALQAARLGLRALIITRGVASEIERLLAPFLEELDLRVIDGEATTTLLTHGSGAARTQRMLAWAGALECGEQLALDTRILHLAPIARETPSSWGGRCAFLGLTPQGLVRSWSELELAGAGAQITLRRACAPQIALAARCDALVLSQAERESCAELIESARAGGASIAVTAGAASKTLLLPEGGQLLLEPVPVRHVRDDLGAGDVFAAAFFTCLQEGRSPLQAARFASTAAALRCEGEGPGAIATRELVERRLLDLDERRQTGSRPPARR